MGASSLRPSLLLRLALLLFLAERGVCGSFTRGDFPSDFVFGAGTSAYQYEGAVDEDGRKPSIWDTFTHEGRSPYKSNGDVASDGYHKYKEDVKLMSDMGLEAYKFSISWSRLLPDGRGVINAKGLNYYNNVINEILKQGQQGFTKTICYTSSRPMETPANISKRQRVAGNYYFDEFGGHLNASSHIFGQFVNQFDISQPFVCQQAMLNSSYFGNP